LSVVYGIHMQAHIYSSNLDQGFVQLACVCPWLYSGRLQLYRLKLILVNGYEIPDQWYIIRLLIE
jgi:hypothetical protein